MQPYQKVNMYPGIYVISRKNYLARNLMRMQKCYPEEYDFFPKTWILPFENIDLRNHAANLKQNRQRVTYIVKPDSLSQGKGIFLSQDIEHIISVCSNQVVNKAMQDHPQYDSSLNTEKIGYVV